MVLAAASPSPAPHAAAGRPHPTYTKMITYALTELGGASPRPAIAGYILDSFSGLPASHDALLSAHLRRLVAEGVLRAHGSDSYIFDPLPPPPPSPPPPAEEEKRGPREDNTPAAPVPVKRGPGRPRKSLGIATPSSVPAKRKRAVLPGDDDDAVTNTGRPTAQEEAVPVKRGRGRPRKTPQASPDRPHTGAAMHSLLRNGQSPTTPTKDKSLQPGDDNSVTKRGPGKPTTHQAAPIQARAEVNFQNGGDATPVQSRGASSTGFERGRGRLRKEKPPAAAISPESGMAASSPGMKRGRGRPRKEKPSEAANSPTAGSVAALRGFKRGCGRPSMGRPSAAAAASYENGVAASMGIKTGSGTPGMDKPAAATISAETGMEKLAAAAMYAETGHAASEGIQAGVGQSKFEKLAAAVAAMSAETIKRGRGRPRKDKPAAPAGVKRSRGRPRKDQCIDGLVKAACEVLFRDATEASTRRKEEDLVSGEKTQTEEGVAPRMEESSAARSLETRDAASTGIKRPRGRPRKNQAAAMSAETGDAASTRVKRGRGRPRKDQSIGTGSVETSRAVLFRDMAEASTNQEEDLVSAEKTETGGVAPGDREEAREADAGCVPVSGENATRAPSEAAGAIGSELGSANL